MKQLLSYKSLRFLKIAESLIVDKDFISYDDIREMNDCSRQTVMDDVNYLGKHWKHLIIFEIMRDGIKSSNRSIHDLMIFKSEIYHSEIKVQFLLSVFLQPNLNIIKHAEILSYSVSHLRRQIGPINTFLKKFDSKITFNPVTDGYYLSSTNELLCSMMLMELIELSLHSNLLPKATIEYDERLDDLFNFISLDVPELAKISMKNFTLVTSIRGSGGFFNNSHKKILEASFLICNSLYKYFLYEANSYAQKLGLKISHHNRELIAITFTIMANKAMFITSDIDNHMNRFDYFYKSFKKRKIRTSAILEEHVEYMDIKYNTNFSGFIPELAFHLHTNAPDLNHPVSFNMGVYSDFGNSHALSLISSITNHFPRQNVSVYDENSTYDIIVSTKSLDNINKNCTLVKISDFITIRDVAAIYNTIHIENQLDISQITQ